MIDGIWQYFSDQGYQPHGYCLMWNPAVFWTHVASDVAIAGAYFSITVAIFYLAAHRQVTRYGWLMSMFGVFIVACGVTHMLGVWTMWVPSYGAEAVVKAGTAAVSVATAVALWPLMPTLVALPSTQMLEDKNTALQREIADRLAAQAQLQTLNDELESRVRERTRVLEETNAVLAEAMREAEAANRLKSEFLATMSHEIRTPMNGVIGMLELVKHSGLNARQAEYVAVATESGLALMHVLNDILDYSRMEASTLSIDPVAYAPAALVRDVVALYRPQAEKKGLSVVLTLPDGDDPMIVGDAARVRQVLSNLISNAVKFTASGEVQVTLTRVADPSEGPRIRVEVADTGIGMSAQTQGRLFQRFSQADGSVSRRFGGSGLGLAICRQLVTLMGGEIAASSIEGEGSRFWFTLPAPSASIGRAQSAPTAQAANEPGMRVLLVEDNEINRRVARAVLEAAGYVVDEAVDGFAALASASERYDGIVMDISMPGMDGVEATRRIRAGGGPSARAPIIALTARAMSGDRERFIAAGMNDHVAKPFTPDKLLNSVSTAMRLQPNPTPPGASAGQA